LASEFGVFDVADGGVLEHGGDVHRLTGTDGERHVARVFRIERIGPVGIQVDGVSDHQARIRRKTEQNVIDLLVGLLRHPAVDHIGRSVAVALQVQLLHVAQEEIPCLQQG